MVVQDKSERPPGPSLMSRMMGAVRDNDVAREESDLMSLLVVHQELLLPVLRELHEGLSAGATTARRPRAREGASRRAAWMSFRREQS